ncbi:tetratricopeptide repeat protein [Aggregicoccus sp. 17bor-14]|uniref:tetratricopeptide repeat protein n=1 Tax=Myxococcaceae TaxID=31 RepID=UPI00129CF9E2|nr:MULTISPECIES: tetratricopeptide repeat protein [Myxococcaceae]MBF5041017.1 tetratricopeptide repeat protein [Simulacricoccus sp. 17bor-14]MRI86803.1 tetratricopeptide repeat protein [Aggregicoccus sp. 17bor-14]
MAPASSRRLLCALLCLGLAASGCSAHRTAAPTAPRERARALVEAGKPAEAIALLEGLHAAAPDDLELARALTEAQVKAGRTDAWIAELERRNRAHERASQHYMLGLAHFSRSAGAGEPAIRAFERAIALAPGEAELHHRLGIALLESEQYAQAVGPLRRAVELAPGRAGLQLPLAKALHRTGDTQGAVAALSALVQQSPSRAEVATARALMEQISDPFARLPKGAGPRFEEGLRALHEQDVPQQAILAFEEVLHDFPDLAVVHALLGLAYQRLDDAGRAVEEYRRALELAPSDGKTHQYLGELYLARQRPESARPEFQQAVALHPLLDVAWYQLGDLELQRHDLGAARRCFQVLSALQPDSPAPHGKLALVLQLEGDWKGADRELHAVLDGDPENVEFALRLGLLHAERAGKTPEPAARRAAQAEAEKWLRQVLEAQPENAVASRALASLRGQ